MIEILDTIVSLTVGGIVSIVLERKGIERLRIVETKDGRVIHFGWMTPFVKGGLGGLIALQAVSPESMKMVLLTSLIGGTIGAWIFKNRT